MYVEYLMEFVPVGRSQVKNNILSAINKMKIIRLLKYVLKSFSVT